MSSYQLLNFFREHIGYFDGVKIEDFDTLLALDNSGFSLDMNKMYQVTPLLKQIIEYALINEVIYEEQFVKIELAFEDRGEDILYEALDFINYCNMYVRNLVEVDCHHPSVRKIENILKIMFLYNDIMDDATLFLPYLSGKDKDNMDYYLDMVDSEAIKSMDADFEKIMQMIDECKFKTPQQLLATLKKYTMAHFKNMLLLDVPDKNCTIFDGDVFVKNDSRMLYLSKALSIINLFDTPRDEYEQIPDFTQEINEKYNLFQSYRYYYTQSDIQEQDFLRKVKKCK